MAIPASDGQYAAHEALGQRTGAPMETSGNIEPIPTYMAGRLVVADLFEFRNEVEQAQAFVAGLDSQGFLEEGDQLIIATRKADSLCLKDVLRSRASTAGIAEAIIKIGGVEISPVYLEGYTTVDCSVAINGTYPKRFIPLPHHTISAEDIRSSKDTKRKHFGLLDYVLEDLTSKNDTGENLFNCDRHARTKVILFGTEGEARSIRKVLAPPPPLLTVIHS